MELDLRQLRAFQVLIEEPTLTEAARQLRVTQPAISKTLAKLRQHFGDPLFTRVGHRMEPTAKALALAPEIRAILERLTSLKSHHVPFDPGRSDRVFRFAVVDAGIVRLLPRLIETLSAQAPSVRLQVAQLDERRLEPELESGRLDFAMGSYPSLSSKIRSQPLWRVRYLSAARRGHPRVTGPMSSAQYASERHVLVSMGRTGHAHQSAERALLDVIPARNVVCTVPSFVTAAHLASETDAIVTLPAGLLESLADKLQLNLFEPPVELPRIQISQHWHERFHREPGNLWIRQAFGRLFRELPG